MADMLQLITAIGLAFVSIQSIAHVVSSIYHWLGAPVTPALITDKICNATNIFSIIDPLSLYLGIGIMIAALFYLIGIITKRNDYINYIKNEIPEIVLIILIIPFLRINCLDLFNIGISNFDAGKMLWLHSVGNIGMATYITQISAGVMAPLLTSSVNIGTNDQASFGGLWMFAKATFSNMLTIYIIGLVMARVMLFVYEFITYGFFVYLLPIAFMLRAFPQSKRFGGTLVGLTFGSLLLMPILCAAFFALFKDVGLLVYDPNANPPLGNFDINWNAGIYQIFTNNQLFFQQPPPPTGSQNLYSQNLYNPPQPSQSISGYMPLITFTSGALNILSRFGIFGASSQKLQNAFNIIFSISLIITIITYVIIPGLMTASILATSMLFIVPIFMNAIKIFTGIFGEPIDLSNLTRLI